RYIAAARALIASADVLIEGFRPGVMERLGLGPESCPEKLIYGRMTGWGQTGPWAQTAGHDINYLALTGALHAMGSADAPPVPPLNMVADYGGGTMFLLLGIRSAVIERGVTAGTVGRPLTRDDLAQALEEGAAGALTGMFLGGAGQAVTEVRGAAPAPTEVVPPPPPAPVVEETKFRLDDLLGRSAETGRAVEPPVRPVEPKVSEKPPQVSDIPPRAQVPEVVAPQAGRPLETSDALQGRIDKLEDKLAAQKGEDAVVAFKPYDNTAPPVFDAPVDAATLRSLYRRRDRAIVFEDRGEMSAAIESLSPEALSGPLNRVEVRTLVDKIAARMRRSERLEGDPASQGEMAEFALERAFQRVADRGDITPGIRHEPRYARTEDLKIAEELIPQVRAILRDLGIRSPGEGPLTGIGAPRPDPVEAATPRTMEA
ncbi:hypothetical protein LCGC14_2723230, partial [marine sediment metagenome]